MLNDDLIKKLDGFIRKFYKNIMLKGLFYSVILLVVFYLLLTLFEFLNYNSTVVRTILFYAYIVFASVVLVVFVLRPWFKMMKIGKTIDRFEAAKIIGDYFPEVADKLLNLLQLQEMSKTKESELLLATVEQRTKQLSPIDFRKAIDTKKAKKAAKVACVVVVLLALVAIIFPNFLSEPTFRYLNHSTYFEKPAPFSFELQNRSLKVLQQADLTLRVKVSGKALPEQAEITIDGQRFSMRKENKNLFSYELKRINKNCTVVFSAAGVESRPYTVEVSPKPILTSVSASVVYPAYTKMKSEELSGINNISVPKGATIVWNIQTKDADALTISFDGKAVNLPIDKKGKAQYKQIVTKDTELCIATSNRYTDFADSLGFSIFSNADLFPQIAVLQQRDSLLPKRILFRGQIKDDYGFSKLCFFITKKENGKTIVLHKDNLEVTQSENVQEFYHYCDLEAITLPEGENLEYFFQVWDNDAVSGNKSSKSMVFVLKNPSKKELEEMRDNNSEQLKSESEQLISEIRQLQKQIDELNRKLIEKKELAWQDKKQLKELAEKQKELQEKIEQIKDRLEENNRIDEAFSQENSDILEKQKELEELFDQLMDKDMKKMLEEIQKLTNENIDKQKLNEALQNIKMSNQDISKQLDRNIELFKRFEVEKKTSEVIERLEDLAKEQKDLADKLNKQSNEETAKQQQKLNEDFRSEQDKLSEIEKQKRELNEDLQRNKEQESQINQQQKQAKDNIEKNKKQKARENMQNAAEQMQQMAQQLSEQQQQENQEQLGEDIEQVRAMLKNLVRLSMQQEELIKKTKTTKVSESEYQNIIRKQNNIKEDMKMLQDSLFAMSKRQPQVGNMINQELSRIDNHLNKTMETLLRYNQVHYSEHKNTSASSSQQYAMSSMNNLALMLTESIENMKQQQQQQSSNSKGKPQKQCSNPSQGKSGNPQSMQQMQQALNKELERLQKELEKQKNNGNPKIGEGAKLNEQLAKAAAQQEMIRKMLKQAADEAKRASGGKANKKLEEMQRQMEQTEKEIVNKSISRQTINRQANILTRLLEFEKAEKKQGEDNKRKSNEGKDKTKTPPKDLIEFEKLKNREMELFKQIPAVYSPFYKQKVNDYFYGNGSNKM